MSVKNPKEFWKNVSNLDNWRDYILPNRSDEKFDEEGFLESNRLYYFFDQNSNVVDYGCGIGRVAKYVSERADKVVGLDINPDFIEKAKKYAIKDNLTFFVSDSFDKKDWADFIYSIMVLQHNDKSNRDLIIDNIKNILKKDGKAIIQFPKIESNYYKETDFVHKFTLEEIKEYGNRFSSYEIVKGNLINYATEIDKNFNHEYFLIVTK